MKAVTQLTTMKEGMEVCQEILKWNYRPTLKRKRYVRRRLKRNRSAIHHTAAEWKG
jgi:hypothetical protein